MKLAKAAIAASLLCLGGQARAASWTDALGDKVVAGAVREWAIQVGAGAMVVGQCERKFQPGAADDFLDSITSLRSEGVDNYLMLRIRDIAMESYAKGRLEAATNTLDAAACKRAVDDQIAAADLAGRKAAAAVDQYFARRK